MRYITFILLTVSLLMAEDYICRFPETDSNFHMIVTVISDDSSFIETESTDTAKVENGYCILNFGHYDNELTYSMKYDYINDDEAEFKYSSLSSVYFNFEFQPAW